ncbi:MAG: hypothetical protein FJ267_11500 [Planctomycetes bacterium]|nr:hypothetical protein [Planctomycetota bacterium]
MNDSQTIDKSVTSRIYGHGRGWVFSPIDFADLGARPAVDSTLRRLAVKGSIQRVLRGLYEYPRFSKLLGESLSPNIDQVASALARKFGWRIQASGPVAENIIGLSTQVPGRVVYLSDGPNRVYKVGRTTLSFNHTALKETGFRLHESELIVQALKSIGSERITPEIIERVRRWLPNSQRAKVVADTKTATGWVRSAILKVAENGAVRG